MEVSKEFIEKLATNIKAIVAGMTEDTPENVFQVMLENLFQEEGFEVGEAKQPVIKISDFERVLDEGLDEAFGREWNVDHFVTIGRKFYKLITDAGVKIIDDVKKKG